MDESMSDLLATAKKYREKALAAFTEPSKKEYLQVAHWLEELAERREAIVPAMDGVRNDAMEA